MLFHYMVLYYKANRLMGKISKTWNPDSPTARFPLSRRNPLGFSGISQPGQARNRAPHCASRATEVTRPCSGKEIPTAAAGEGGEGRGPEHQDLGPGLSGWLKEEEELCAGLGTVAAALGNGTAILGKDCVVGSGACKKQVLAASWGTGPNRLHRRPGWAPADIS